MEEEEEVQQNLENLQANQVFPKRSPVLEEENMQVPFPELHGEFTEYVGRAEEAIIAMSNYRLHIKFRESVVNVPLQLIECVDCREMFQLHVTCKDCKVIRCQFSTFEQCQEWLKRLTAVVRPPSRMQDLFSFAFHAWCMEEYAGEKEQHGELCRPGEHVTSWFKNEVERMGFDTQNAWRITDINSRFRLCSSYPQQLLVPAWITDKELENVACFRSWKRFPAVVYRHQANGAVIARCSQPEVSWWGWRNSDDEHLVTSIGKACAVNGSNRNGTDLDAAMASSSGAENLDIEPRNLLILDARSYTAAVANRAKGGGCECPEYYPNCEVVFMGMANIHATRRSFHSLRVLCTTQQPDPANWLSSLEGTKWLWNLSLLMKAALLVVNAVDRDQRPVLVHCSDGWDRTPQIVSLSKLLLDPYYRTIEGFQVLVETEWLDFGHKFADRCGHGEKSDDLNERCPIFLQWLDCVHQMQRQFPCSFEFNEAFLVKLVQHCYSCLFGTFLCNSGKQRKDRRIQERTCSVWSLLRPTNRALRNMLYSTNSETVLHPVCHVRNLMLWTAVYLPSSSPTTPSDDSCAPYPVAGAEEAPLGRHPRTRSFDNLPSACEHGNSLAPNRRSSDPSLNEWQDHRRSLEINVALDGAAEQEVLTNGEEAYTNGPDSEAELSVAVGVAESQMENILKEASKDDSGGSSLLFHDMEQIDTEVELEGYVKADEVETPQQVLTNGYHSANGVAESQDDETPPQPTVEEVQKTCMSSQKEEARETRVEIVQQSIKTSQEVQESHMTSQKEAQQKMEEEVQQSVETTQDSSQSVSGVPEQTEAHRTLTNGFTNEQHKECDEEEEEKEVCLVSDCFVDQRGEHLDKRVSLLESSTETVTEEACCRLEQDMFISRKAELGMSRTLNGGSGSASVSAFQSDHSSMDPHCNGNASSDVEPKINGDRAPLSRQASTASCSSLVLNHHRSCAQHRLFRSLQSRAATSPEQTTRSHLDDDGLTLHTDAIQQRLRQIEAGHQMEVETLRKQVQELWSRLENQQHVASHRTNGHLGDEMTSGMDSEYNMDPNCLSHCSAEFFSEGSWEQVDRRDTEVTRWYPDHLAAQCYGCEQGFWLVNRKHHCRGRQPVQEAWNCGNVFCSNCCDQKIPVPSQQLFEPTRVCKSCFSSLQPGSSSLDSPITASST
ncbi:phosphatidylinositol-3,5-bisphosphate 3-phosphatase MTMR3 isoform X3 [Gouania willdenowi]|nr:myotubularin-related protein 3 isoform X3 [Gouania willdenowi]